MRLCGDGHAWRAGQRKRVVCRDSVWQTRGAVLPCGSTGKGEEVHLPWCKPSSQASCLPAANAHAPCTYSSTPLSTPESCRKRWRKRRLRLLRALPCSPCARTKTHKDKDIPRTDKAIHLAACSRDPSCWQPTRRATKAKTRREVRERGEEGRRGEEARGDKDARRRNGEEPEHCLLRFLLALSGLLHTHQTRNTNSGDGRHPNVCPVLARERERGRERRASGTERHLSKKRLLRLFATLSQKILNESRAGCVMQG